MVLFEKCCFCVPLRTGCLVIGYLNLIGTVIALGLSIFTIIFGIQTTHSSKPELVDVGYLIIGIAAALAVILVLALAFCIILLLGIYKNKPEHVKAFLIYNLIFLIIFAILLVVKIVRGMNGIIDGILQLVFGIYFFLVIKSYHTKMQEEKGTVSGVRNSAAAASDASTHCS